MAGVVRFLQILEKGAVGRWEGWAVLAGFGGDADEVEGGGGGGTRASKISSVKAIGRDAFFFWHGRRVAG
jgi:hypothetical protein